MTALQEEINDKTINLAVNTTKLTARTVMNGLRSYLNSRSRAKAQKTDEVPHGRQTVQELIGQNQGVSSIPIASTELAGFERVAKRYGVDFAIRRDTSVTPSRYTVFFKARDADALTAAYKEYSAQSLRRRERPSVIKKLNQMIKKAMETPRKERNKHQERDR